MTEVTKSSDEILTELFDSFKNEAPSVNSNVDALSPKYLKDVKSKKKHKKDKKHKSEDRDKHRKKKKCKRHKRKESSSQNEKSKSKKKKKKKQSSESSENDVEETQTCKKINDNKSKEPASDDKEVKDIVLVNSDVHSFDVCDTSNIPLPPLNGDTHQKEPLAHQNNDSAKKPTSSNISDVFEKDNDKTNKIIFKPLDKPKMPIKIGNLKNSQVLEVAESQAKLKAEKYEEGEITDETSTESSAHKLKAESSHDSDTAHKSESEDKKKRRHHHHRHHKRCSKRAKSEEKSQKHYKHDSSESSKENTENKENILDTNGSNVKEEEQTNESCEKQKAKNKKSDCGNSSDLSGGKIKLRKKKRRQPRDRKASDSSSESESVEDHKKDRVSNFSDKTLEKSNKSKFNKMLATKKVSKSRASSTSSSSSNSSPNRKNISKFGIERSVSQRKSKRSSSKDSRQGVRSSSKPRSKSKKGISASDDQIKLKSRTKKSISREKKSQSPNKYQYQRRSRSLSRRSRSRNRRSVSGNNRSYTRPRLPRSSSRGKSQLSRSRRSRSKRRNSRSPIKRRLSPKRSRSKSPLRRSRSRNRSPFPKSGRSRSRDRRSISKEKLSKLSRSREKKESEKTSKSPKKFNSKSRSPEKDSKKYGSKKSKDKKSKKKKKKNDKPKDINSRLLALSHTKVDSSSEEDSSSSDSSNSDSSVKRDQSKKQPNVDENSKILKDKTQKNLEKHEIHPEQNDSKKRKIVSSDSSTDSDSKDSKKRTKSKKSDYRSKKHRSSAKSTDDTGTSALQRALSNDKLLVETKSDKVFNKDLISKDKTKPKIISKSKKSDSGDDHPHFSESEGERSDTTMRKHILSHDRSSSNTSDTTEDEKPGNENFTKSSKNKRHSKVYVADKKVVMDTDNLCDSERSVSELKKKVKEKLSKSKGFFNIEVDTRQSDNKQLTKLETTKMIYQSDSDSSNSKTMMKDITYSENDQPKETILVGRYDSDSDRDSDSSKSNKMFKKLNVQMSKDLSVNLLTKDSNSFKNDDLTFVNKLDSTPLCDIDLPKEKCKPHQQQVNESTEPKKNNLKTDVFFDYEKLETDDDKLDFDEDKSSDEDSHHKNTPSSNCKKEAINKTDSCVDKNSMFLPVEIELPRTTKEVSLVSADKTVLVKPEENKLESIQVLKCCSISVDREQNKEFSTKSMTIIVKNDSPSMSVFNSSITNSDTTRKIIDNNSRQLGIVDKSNDKFKMVVLKEEDKIKSPNISEVNISSIIETNLQRAKDFAISTSFENKTKGAIDDLSRMEKEEKYILDKSVSLSRSSSRGRSSKRSVSKDKKCDRNEKRSRSRKDRSLSKRGVSKSKDRSKSRRSRSRDKSCINEKLRSTTRDRRSRSKGRRNRSRERRKRSRDKRSRSTSRKSQSKENNNRVRDKRSREKRSRSRRRGISRSRRPSRDRRSKSKRRQCSRSKDRRSWSKNRRRTRSRDRRSRSRARRIRTRSRSRRRRVRSPSRDKRSKSRNRRDSSRSKGRKSRSNEKRKYSNEKVGRSESSRHKSRSRSKGRKSRSRSKGRKSSQSRSISKGRKRSRSKSRSNIRKSSRSKSQNRNSRSRETNSRSRSKSKIQKLGSRSLSVDRKVFILSTDDIAANLSEKKIGIECKSNVLLISDEINPESKSLTTNTENKYTPAKLTDKSRSPSVENITKVCSESFSANKKSPLLEVANNSRLDSTDNQITPTESKCEKFKTDVKNTTKSMSKERSKSIEKISAKSKYDKERSRSKSVNIKHMSRSKMEKDKSKERKSRSRERKPKASRKRSKSRSKHSKSRDKSSRSKEKRSRSKERRSRSKEKRSRSKDRNKSTRDKRSKSRDKKSRRSRSRSRRRKTDKKDNRSHRSRSRSKSRSHKHPKKSRSRSRGKDEFYIDKSKLLEIARKNALSMMKQGTVGTDLNKVTAITAGGKTVDELTDFCKLLSQKEATGQESVSSESSSENESEKPFHHPFQLKERSNNIIMNIRNCAALPVKTHQEKTTENAQQLRLQFPVSSGQLHRKSENEWVPVSPKKPDDIKAIMPPPPTSKQEDEVAILPPIPEAINFSNIPLPSQQPLPIQPPPTMSQMTNPWGQNHDSSGLFTGTTGVRMLSQAELASGQQAWAKKDQLICAQPVIGGMGMSLLQKMGWKPGEGLGKRNEGTLEPLKLQVKMDKRGLLCAEEMPQPRFRPHQLNKMQPTKSLESKHPVSLLVEYCTRKHLNPPLFTVIVEDGPAHKKSFIFKVTVNGVDYQPPNPSPNKKVAKSEAAVLCLRALGLLPTV